MDRRPTDKHYWRSDKRFVNQNHNQLNYSYDKVEGELGGRGELGVAFLASIPYRDTGRNELQMWWRRRVWPWGLHHRRRRSSQGFELYKIFIFHFASNFLSLVQIRGLHLYTTIRGHAMHGYILSISPQNAIKKVKMGNGQSRYWCTSMSLSACLWSTTTNHCFSPTSIPGWCDWLQER